MVGYEIFPVDEDGITIEPKGEVDELEITTKWRKK